MNSNNLKAIEIENYYNIIKCSKGKIYFEESDKNKIATIIFDDGIKIIVKGNLSEDIIIKIIEKMQT